MRKERMMAYVTDTPATINTRPVTEEQLKEELERRQRLEAEYQSQAMMRDEIQHHRMNAHHNVARLFDQAVQELNSMVRPAPGADASWDPRVGEKWERDTQAYHAVLGRVQVLAGVLKDLGGPY